MLIRDRPLTALFAAVCRAHVWRGGTSALTFVRSLSQCFSILLYMYSPSVLLDPIYGLRLSLRFSIEILYFSLSAPRSYCIASQCFSILWR